MRPFTRWPRGVCRRGRRPQVAALYESSMTPNATSMPPPGLLEREREVGTLAARIAAAAAGEGCLVAVEGPAGIGKSRLLAEGRRLAGEAGMRVLTARGGELEREFPFGIARQLFEPVIADPDLAPDALAGSAGAARSVFAAVEAPGDGDDVSFSVLHGLYWLAANLTTAAPLALVVDDLHWCDRPSLRFLSYLVKRLEGLPLVVLTSLRPSEPGADAGLIAEITGDALAVSVRPRALSVGAVASLTRARLGEQVAEDFVEACRDASGGNPLFLNELLKALDADGVTPGSESVEVVRRVGPRAASRAVLVRLARLPESTVAVARALSVLGEGSGLDVLAELAGVSVDEAAEATAGLARSEIVEREPPLRFVHPLVRAAVYHDLSAGEREVEHARAAAILAAAGAPADQVAAHQLQLPPRGDPEVVRTLRRAGADALGRGAPEIAAVLLERALREPPSEEDRPEVLLELGRSEAFSSGVRAAERFSEALQDLRDPATRASASDALARMLMFSGSHDAALQVAREAADEVPPGLDDLRRRLEAVELYATFLGAPPPPDAQERFAQARVAFTGEGVGGLMLNSVAAWAWTCAGGGADECAELAIHATADGTLSADDPGTMAIPALITLTLAGRDRARELIEAMGREAHARSSVFASMGYHLFTGIDDFHRGDFDAAREHFDHWRLDGDLWAGDSPGWPLCAAYQARTLLAQGDPAGAADVLDVARTRMVAPTFILSWRCSLGQLRIAQGRVDEAITVLQEVGDAAPPALPPAWLPWRANLADALNRQGQTAAAIALAEEDLAHARTWGAPGAVGAALRALGTLHRTDGIPLLEDAVAHLERSPWRYEHAQALAALGAAIRRDRRPTEAREPLRAALEMAETCGAGALVAEVRAEIHATGARPRSTALSGVGALTSSERRVAAMAAEGLSNREIAQALYVTPKTIELHLSSAYRKLGIRSRHDLAAALV